MIDNVVIIPHRTKTLAHSVADKQNSLLSVIVEDRCSVRSYTQFHPNLAFSPLALSLSSSLPPSPYPLPPLSPPSSPSPLSFPPLSSLPLPPPIQPHKDQPSSYPVLAMEVAKDTLLSDFKAAVLSRLQLTSVDGKYSTQYVMHQKLLMINIVHITSCVGSSDNRIPMHHVKFVNHNLNSAIFCEIGVKVFLHYVSWEKFEHCLNSWSVVDEISKISSGPLTHDVPPHPSSPIT